MAVALGVETSEVKICWRQEAGHNLIYSRFGAQATEKRQEGDSGSGLKVSRCLFCRF